MSALNQKALQVFLNQPVSRDMVHKLVVATLQVLPCKETKGYEKDGRPLPSLMTFLTRLVKYTNIYTGTLMATLVYLQRLKSRLPPNAQGLPCTRHRILLSCIILSSKFHNDSSPKNCHWAEYTDGLFSAQDVNLMERQLYYLLDWDLKVPTADLIQELESFLAPIRMQMVRAVPSFPVQSYASTPRSSVSSASSSPMGSPTGLYRNNSISSLSSTSSYEVDPVVEMTALKEEQQLKQLLSRLNNGAYTYDTR
ncbi:PHO85 cyclin-1 [Diutina catenulata]